MTNQPHICAQCGIQVSESELYTFDGQLLCLHCLEANTITLPGVWRADLAGRQRRDRWCPPLSELL